MAKVTVEIPDKLLDEIAATLQKENDKLKKKNSQLEAQKKNLEAKAKEAEAIIGIWRTNRAIFADIFDLYEDYGL